MNCSWLAVCVFGVAVAAGTAAAQGPSPLLMGPPPSDGPVVVRLGYFLSAVNLIDEGNQRFEVEGILTLQWQDDRLAFDPMVEGTLEKVYQGDSQLAEAAVGWWPQVVLANESGRYERQGILLRRRADGHITYLEEMNAAAEMPLELRRFPFDREHFDLAFEVLGFDINDVVLEPDLSTTGKPERGISISQWRLEALEPLATNHPRVYQDGGQDVQSAVSIRLTLAREPGFMLRVVVLPMALLVALSWAVFWMDRESLGNRMDISFIAILTVVAYQIMVSSSLPKIPYFTLMSAFIYASLVTVSAGVVVNLVVDQFDRTGRKALGDRTDRICRWAFPVAYLTQILLATAYFFIRY